jgi:predicted alpha/beta superfamily hydrolase
MAGGYFYHHTPFHSKLIPPRQVDVWMPEGLHPLNKNRYPVIYMHDGQNLFDPKTSFIGVDWGVHETLCRLIDENRVRPAMVVGIWSATARGREYGPGKAILKYASKDERRQFLKNFGKPISDDYLKFIVKELKPFIDKNYPTLPGHANTFVMGSSFGGLISLYALCEYPEVFSGAGCLSTHWPAADGAMIPYLAVKLPDPKKHRVYFDYGTEAMDAKYEPYQIQVDSVMRLRGYKENINWVTEKFDGEEHSERAWRKRLHIPLQFLLSKNSVKPD